MTKVIKPTSTRSGFFVLQSGDLYTSDMRVDFTIRGTARYWLAWRMGDIRVGEKIT